MTNPFVKDVRLVQPQVNERGLGFVILDRVEPGVTPEYCTHGKTNCYRCQEWCWLGDKTYEVVATGRAAGLCQQCGAEVIPKGQEPSERIRDHRRSEGPH